MKMYKIKAILHTGEKGTRGVPRTDGKYPARVGRTVQVDASRLEVGRPLILDYVKDENGEDYSGYFLRCSRIEEIHASKDALTVETHNSIYELEETQEDYEI